jgi:hypothetical protein
VVWGREEMPLDGGTGDTMGRLEEEERCDDSGVSSNGSYGRNLDM